MGFMAIIPMVISAAAAVAGGVAASNAADYQAQVAENNVKISAQKQKYMMEDYSQKETARAMNDRAKMGGLDAQLSANGMTNSGSTKDVIGGEGKVLNMSGMAHANAFKTDWYSEKSNQINAGAQAQLAKMESENSMTVGLLGGASSAAKSASTLDEKYGYFS
jgi:hypothetical protein